MEIPSPLGTTGPLVAVLGRLSRPSNFRQGTTGHVGFALGDSDAAIYVSRLDCIQCIFSTKFSIKNLTCAIVEYFWICWHISHSLEKGANSECFKQDQSKQRLQAVYQPNQWRLKIECQSEEMGIC